MTGAVIMKYMGEGMDPKAAFDYKAGSRLWEVGKLHGIVSIVDNAVTRMQTIEDANLAEVMNCVLNYFLLDMAEDYAKLLARSNSMNLNCF